MFMQNWTVFSPVFNQYLQFSDAAHWMCFSCLRGTVCPHFVSRCAVFPVSSYTDSDGIRIMPHSALSDAISIEKRYFTSDLTNRS